MAHLELLITDRRAMLCSYLNGADGEFVIYVREDERESVSEARKGTKSTEDNQ
jgi:hypothetical protein